MVERRVTIAAVQPLKYPGMLQPRPEVEVKCCGEWLCVSGRFTTTCDHCDTDYNSAGQELAPREFWGEETGEHWSECY